VNSLLRILHLEDDRRDAELAQIMLETEGFACQVTRVETRVDFCASLERDGFNIILADYTLPSFDGISALRIAAEKRPEVPFIFVSGTLGEEVAIEALNVGATDYVLKTRLSRLVPSVVRALREATERAERKRAEESLRRSETYLAEAQRLSHTGSFGWRPSSGEIYFSEETFRIFEFDRSTTPTLDLMRGQRIHPEDVASWQQVVDRAAQEGQDYAHEYRLRMLDGSVKHLHVVAHAIRAETGDVDFAGAVKDVTEEKWAHGERERLEQRLRQAAKMEAVGQFASGIAHDFNNVLTSVYAYGEIAFDEAPADSRLKRYAQNVLTAASRGRELVEQILTYSRSQRGKREPVDVTSVVAETLELLRGSLPAGIRLEAGTPTSPLITIGDATQLHQVVMNLCSNAIQAMRGGGILRVMHETLELTSERALSHGTLGAGSYLRLIVEDSGSGMEEATLARIFEAFFTTKEVGKGTGLGLSLVYAIVTDLGGAIDVKSALRKGTTITIYLPRTEATLAAAESGPAMPLRGHGERVLLIDDDAPVLAAATDMLSRLGYEAVSFSDSDAALAAFVSAPERFDVVVSNEFMPGLTRTALSRVVRHHRPDMPIVLMSGYSSEVLTRDAHSAGVSELVTKPLQSREIANTLARVLHRTA
jgi:signal transduction histidine kinase